MKLLSIALLTAASSITNIESANIEHWKAEPMKWTEESNPATDVKNAIERKDYRFYGLYGFTPIVPSVSSECHIEKAGIKYLDEIRDAFHGPEQVKKNAKATTYMNEYNTLMLEYLAEGKIFDCP